MRLAGILVAILVAAAVPAGAEILVKSKQPYWKVGPRDEALSRACSLNRFNLARPERYQARFSGPEGSDTLGIGKGTGANLYDPDKRRKPAEDYYFRNHGTTECEVYVGGRKGRAGG